VKILLIDPSATTCESLHRQLLKEGHRVNTAQNGMAGWQMIQVQAYDIVFLNSSVSNPDHYHTFQRIRKIDLHVPVLFYNLTPHVNDQSADLVPEADLQVAYPTSVQEILFQMRALCKGFYLRPARWLHWAGLDLNLTERTVYRNGKGIDLTERECHLLAIMMQGHGQVLQRDFLLQQVWACTETYRTNTLEVYISYLRKKIDKNFSPKLIQTIVGIGYKLVY
jgi:two-component system copper resistance phosphate regulon response regulator CusR